jgi:regulator of protease activity HflC (stomatin/prohibitin superfamily)
MLSGCSSVKVDAGQEAVLTKQPIFFGSGGVDPTPVKTGRAFVAWTTKAIVVDMRPVQAQVEFNDLMSKNGIPLDFDSALLFQVTDSVRLIEKFGPDWYQNMLAAEYQNIVRQSVRRYEMNDIAINSNAIEAIDTEVTKRLTEYIKRAGLPINLLKVSVGRANPPEDIKKQRIQTAAQEQRKLTEDQRMAAEGSRLGAEQARAAADNAYRAQMSLSPQQFVELERIKMLQQVCGGGKCTFIQGNAQPIIDAR